MRYYKIGGRVSKLKWSRNYLKFWKKDDVETFDFNDPYEFITFWMVIFLILCLSKVVFYYLSGYLLSVAAMVFFAGVFFSLVSETKSTRLAHICMCLAVAYFCDYFFQGAI